MRRMGLAVATLLLFAPFAVGQHSSGGGGSSGGSSSSGGSHSSSGGAVSHSAGAGSGASHSRGGQPSSSNKPGAISKPAVARPAVQREKRSFASFLRHPLRKPHSKPEADLRRRICEKGSCPVCPAGQVSGTGGACVASPPTLCRTGASPNGGACAPVANFHGNDCSLDPDTAARRNMEEAKRSMEAACSQDPTRQECSEESVAYQRAQSLYKQRQENHLRAYEDCQRRTSPSSTGP